MKTTPEYKTLTRKIKQATTLDELNILDKKIDKIYNAGCLTVNELQRLDLKIVDKKIKYGLL